jgi:hypothetical protein
VLSLRAECVSVDPHFYSLLATGTTTYLKLQIRSSVYHLSKQSLCRSGKSFRMKLFLIVSVQLLLYSIVNAQSFRGMREFDGQEPEEEEPEGCFCGRRQLHGGGEGSGCRGGFGGGRGWGHGHHGRGGGYGGGGMGRGYGGGCMGRGYGGGCMGRGGGGGGGGGMCPRHKEMRIIHSLLDNHSSVHRNFTNTETGVKTYTWSEDPQISDWIKIHVAQMQDLVRSGGRIRMWDPLFEAQFDHRDELDLKSINVTEGVHVTLTGTSKCGTSLVQSHAKVVSDFVARGREAACHQSHKVPKECSRGSSTVAAPLEFEPESASEQEDQS